MVKHIKKSYKKDGELTDDEKSIAYATAWKDYNKESFEINPEEHKKAKRISKIRNLAKNNKNPAEKEAAEKKAGGPKLIGEGKLDRVMDTVRKYTNKNKKKPTPHKYPPGASGGDAGKAGAKKLRDKEQKKYVGFLPANEQKIWDRLKLNIK